MDSKTVAVKMLQKADNKTLPSILDEVSLLRAVHHDNVIQCIDFIDSLPAILMELAEGGTLKDYLLHLEKPIGYALRMKWTMQLTDAVAYLHSIGIVHSKALHEVWYTPETY